MPESFPRPDRAALPTLALAVALSLGAAVSLGLTRFSYALLLPPMRADLGWSYLLAGGMNTANAVGYLVGALAMPLLLRRHAPATSLLVGTALATLLMAACGFLLGAPALLLQRLLAGIASAVVFVAGGLMAARLGALDPRRSGLLLGVYYGGVGWGIAASALLVPLVLAHAPGLHNWAWAWWLLALVCAGCTAALAWPARVLQRVDAQGGVSPAAAGTAGAPTAPVPLRALAPALAGYAMFGVGYIGYMTFVIALLQEQGLGVAGVTAFYTLLGLAVVASARVWAGLLERSKGGGALALLNALLGVATVLPALTSAWPVVLASGLLFGGVFLSLVASTTALVRHNLPPAQWAAGISAFTIVFAIGQILGPTVVGAIADAAGGLARGLVFSACALWLGALLAWRQRPL
ncbi:MAG: MFS transporter [Acidovorax sp. SCN 68-22]|jgi:predicted MFS family arabinose efflux permease|nr:MAG: MFS transporter [Acidovorax sp. SCN 68-22]